MHDACIKLFLVAAVLILHAELRADAAPRELDARQTVVIANRNVPESVELARHYMQARGIPADHLCELDLPAGETMARWFYVHALRDPLQAFLRERRLIEQVRRDDEAMADHENPWRTIEHHVKYIVSMYGVPLRIAETRPFWQVKLANLGNDPFHRDGAAVDSELACLLWDRYEIAGFQPNGMYNTFHWSRPPRSPRPLLIAARLDGPDPATVRRMIDDAVAAESNGLRGIAYIDIRSTRDPEYLMGDYWLREAAERIRRTGMEVRTDQRDALFPADEPMPDAALYLGWYAEHVAGPFTRADFRFQPGTIAYHLHSTSAYTLRDTRRHWAAPLLAAGATAVMGSVDEPFLAFTPDLQIFTDRICAGYTFGESAYFSLRAVSWQITVVGDPLYQPFPRGAAGPEIQP